MEAHKIEHGLILLGILLTACTDDSTSSPTISNTNHSTNASIGVVSSPTPPFAAATRQLDVPYVPTPEKVINEMLQMAEVQESDVLYDLGSGDGRIPVTAAKRFGTRGVGIDLNPQRIREANENAQNSEVTNKVKFIQGDLFDQDISEATVVTLYLLPEVNLKLRPKILQMKPGTRIVSHNYDMGDWAPEKFKVVKTEDGIDHYVYFWRVPEQKQ